MRLLYSLVLYLLLPPVFAYFWWRGRHEPAYRQRWSERLGHYRGEPAGIWLHAASLGEVQAARPLIEALVAAYPQQRVCVTTFTPAGSEQLARLFGDRITHSYLPLDVPHAVRRFLRSLQPRIAIIIETEIWPNLYLACEREGVPLVIASASLSESSLARLSVFPGRALLRRTVQSVAAASAQTTSDAGRLREAGLSEDRVTVGGNLKFDYRSDVSILERGRSLREAWGAARPVWIAASTHAGEEEAVLGAHRRLLDAMPRLLLLLVPRHPQRFDEVARICARSGLRMSRRGAGEDAGADTQLLLADTLGELNLLYAAADVAFVGGSLVPIGGHNLLEPVALGLPVVAGPHLDDQQQIADVLTETGSLTRIADEFTLAEAVGERLQSDVLRRQLGSAGRHVIERNQGTVQRVLALVAAHLPAATVPEASQAVPARR